MTERELDDLLQDILEAIGAIERFISGVSFEEFAQNEEKIFVVEKAIERMFEKYQMCCIRPLASPCQSPSRPPLKGYGVHTSLVR